MGALAPQITSLPIVHHRLFRHRSKETSKLRVTGLCEGKSPGAGEFPARMASYAENASIWWRHHVDVRKQYTNNSDNSWLPSRVISTEVWFQNSLLSRVIYRWKHTLTLSDIRMAYLHYGMKLTIQSRHEAIHSTSNVSTGCLWVQVV